MANSERDSVQQNLIDKNAITLNALNLHSDVQLRANAEEADNARLAATPDDNLTKDDNDRLASGCGLTDQGTHEAHISRLCFIVGVLQSITLNSEDSGAFSLGPGKGSAKLVLPSEAIQQGRKLTVRYGTLLDGPFRIPEDCYIVGPVQYIDYNISLVKNPLELHLSHWYAGEAKDWQKTMTFLKAPHVPDKNGLFRFDKCDSGLFMDDEQFGVLKLQNHLCLICVAVEKTQQPCPSLKCRVMLLRKQADPRTVSFALYLTFDDVAWITVIRKYIVEEMGWTEGGLAGPQLLYLKCQDQDAGRIDRVTATAEPSSGSLWRIFHEGCPSISCHLMLEWLQRYHRSPMEDCNRMEEEITSRLFPPCIQLRLAYDADPRSWTSTQMVELVVNSVMSPDHESIRFPLQVKVPADHGTHEAHISRFCFIVGDLLSLTLNSEDSGVFSLGPGKGSAKLFVPSEAILQGRELTIKHCTLLDGPFHIPKDCYIVSPVLYIDYNVSLVKNALELHLNHWYAGEDQQKTMTFLKASHVPDEKGFFNFEKCDGGLFNDDVHFGVLKLHNHLCLICVAVKRTQLSSLKCSCRVMLLKKQFEDPRIVSFALYLIFDNVEWIEIVKTYIELGMGWTKGSLAPPSRITLRVQEQAIANEREDGVEVTANPDSGPHWAIHHEGNRSLPCSVMLEWMERYHRHLRDHCNRLQEEITTRLFPPCIQLRLRYNGDPRNWTSTQQVVLKVKRSMSTSPTEDIQFLQEVQVPGHDTQTLPPQRNLPNPIQTPGKMKGEEIEEGLVQRIYNEAPDKMKGEEIEEGLVHRIYTEGPGKMKAGDVIIKKQVPPLNIEGPYSGSNKDSGDGPIKQYYGTPDNMKDEVQRQTPSPTIAENEWEYNCPGKKLSAPGKNASHQQAIGLSYDQTLMRKEVFEVDTHGRRDQMSECNRQKLLHCQNLTVSVNEQLMHQLQTQDGGVLTHPEAARVMKETNNVRKFRQLIDIMHEKGDKEVHSFCRILGVDGSNINASCARTEEAPECQAEEYTQHSSQNTATIADAGKVAALPQRVYDHPDHLKLFRIHVSRTAAGKGRAVLEGVGLTHTVISACFTSNPQNEEEAVQLGLIKWIEGQGEQPPTWAVLLQAMEYAQIAQQDVKGLKKKLGLDKRS